MPGPIRRDCPLRATEKGVYAAYTPEGMEPQLDPRGNLAEATVERRDGLAIRRWLVTESHPRA